jgi:hypothetical protein
MTIIYSGSKLERTISETVKSAFEGSFQISGKGHIRPKSFVYNGYKVLRHIGNLNIKNDFERYFARYPSLVKLG